MAKIGVVGAGAIGGLVAARFAKAGHAVSVVARGDHLRAIRAQGLKLIEANGESFSAPMARAEADPALLDVQDVLVLGLKAHQITPLIPALSAMIGPHTLVVPMQNGIPFWYCHNLPGPYRDRTVESVDPGGALKAFFNPTQIVGCVVYPASEIESPGVIRHVEGERFSIGELDGSLSPRLSKLAEIFASGGFKAPLLDDVRSEIWLKLWGNLSFNPISALTHTTLAQICRNPASRALATALMQEAQRVGEAMGARFRVSLEKRIAGAEKVGEHKTSMLQDIEMGKEPEIDALVGAVRELARWNSIDTPHLDAVYWLTRTLGDLIVTRKRRVEAVAVA